MDLCVYIEQEEQGSKLKPWVYYHDKQGDLQQYSSQFSRVFNEQNRCGKQCQQRNMMSQSTYNMFSKEIIGRKRKRENNTDDVLQIDSGGYVRVLMLLHRVCHLNKLKFVVCMAVVVYDDHHLSNKLEWYIPMKEIKCVITILTIEINLITLQI